jgi:hypothetical protein
MATHLDAAEGRKITLAGDAIRAGFAQADERRAGVYTVPGAQALGSRRGSRSRLARACAPQAGCASRIGVLVTSQNLERGSEAVAP